MVDLGNFDASKIEPQRSFEPLPAGNYVARIVKTEEKQNSKKTGTFISVELEVIDDGEYKGRRVWDNLNLKNPNNTAVEIARKTLSSICHAVSKLQPRSTEELHNIPLVINVGHETRQNGGISNKIRGYSKLEQQQPQQQQPQQQASGGGSSFNYPTN